MSCQRQFGKTCFQQESITELGNFYGTWYKAAGPFHPQANWAKSYLTLDGSGRRYLRWGLNRKLSMASDCWEGTFTIFYQDHVHFPTAQQIWTPFTFQLDLFLGHHHGGETMGNGQLAEKVETVGRCSAKPAATSEGRGLQQSLEAERAKERKTKHIKATNIFAYYAKQII